MLNKKTAAPKADNSGQKRTGDGFLNSSDVTLQKRKFFGSDQVTPSHLVTTAPPPLSKYCFPLQQCKTTILPALAYF
jgi:hypothetical protein